MSRFALQGSTRAPLDGAQPMGPAHPEERLEATLIVRGKDPAKRDSTAAAIAQGTAAPLTRDAFARDLGADPADMKVVEAFAAKHGLAVVQCHGGRRTVILSGTVTQMNEAFGVQLQVFQHDQLTYRGRTGDIHLPPELKDIVTAVLGLDNRPQAEPRFRLHDETRSAPRRHRKHKPKPTPTPTPQPAPTGSAISYTPLQIADLYGFPPGTGAGQCIGIVELGGGFGTADIKAYFQGLGLTPPTVVAVSVDHGANTPGADPTGADGEVLLDIEVAGAIAPQARIAVYFAPNTSAGFLDAITTAIHDTTNKPSVISISWGGAESTWTQQATAAYDQAFQDAAALGITICCASGDGGSDDGVGDGADHVDFPSSSPNALACGGTSLRGTGSSIASETVWNDGAQGGAGGGGISAVFPVPAYQQGLSATRTAGGSTPLTQRGVPDIAGNADPRTGYSVLIDGTRTVIGGTSAVAPLWAGLIARLNGNSGRPVGRPHVRLYANPSALRDITAGNNGSFAASPGWDACTGLGSPNGPEITSTLTPPATA